MSIVFKNQVEATEKSADALLQETHRRAMFCFDVRDLLRSIVNLFREMGSDVRRWQEANTRGTDQSADQCTSEWLNLYVKLNSICEKSNLLIQSAEGDGQEIEGKRDFLVVWRELRGIVCLSKDQVFAASEQVKQGNLCSLADARNELWNTPVP